MNDREKITARLASLDGIELSAEDIEHITEDIKDIERVVAELEEFARDISWISQQIQPSGMKA